MLQAMEIVLNDEINEQQKHKSARNVAAIDELTPENNGCGWFANSTLSSSVASSARKVPYPQSEKYLLYCELNTSIFTFMAWDTRM
jgi:hypothetical protein